MEGGNDRRDFLKKGLFFAGAAGLMSSGLGPLTALAQTIGKPMRRADRYEDTYIFERKPFKWPRNKTLAVWIAPNVEVCGEPRAGCDQLFLARVRHPSRFVACRGCAGRRGD